MEGKLKQKYIDKFGRNIIYKSIAGVYHFLLLRCSIWKYKWYSNSLRNQKKGTEKISIVFLASMPEFWNSLKTVYQAAMDHSNIEAHLLLLPLKTEYGLWKYKEDNIYNIYPTYKKVFDESTKVWTEIEKFSPDYVFFERPYNNFLPKGYKSSDVVKYAKVCYVPYGYILTKSPNLLKSVFENSFFVNVSFFFASWDVAGKYCERLFHQYGNKNRKVIYLGFPRFDLLPEYIEKENTNNCTILWTPRWTVTKDNINDKSSDTSFFRFKDNVIERCINNKKEKWIVRPHPLAFQNYISYNIMSKEEVELYKKTLNKMENISLDNNKDYLIGFQESDILVTDFSSLIIEYFMMGKPIIYCGNLEALPFKELRDNVYLANQWKDVIDVLEKLKRGIDPLKSRRLLVSKKLRVVENGTIGKAIIQYIVNEKTTMDDR